jgi:hypothetical protein
MKHNKNPAAHLAGGVFAFGNTRKSRAEGGGAGREPSACRTRQIPADTIPSIPTRKTLARSARKQQRRESALTDTLGRKSAARKSHRRRDKNPKTPPGPKAGGVFACRPKCKTPADATSSIAIWESPKSGQAPLIFHRPRKLRRSSSIDAEIGHRRSARPSVSIETASSQSASRSDWSLHSSGLLARRHKKAQIEKIALHAFLQKPLGRRQGGAFFL